MDNECLKCKGQMELKDYFFNAFNYRVPFCEKCNKYEQNTLDKIHYFCPRFKKMNKDMNIGRNKQ